MSMTMAASRETAGTLARRFMEIAHPGLTGRAAALERCAIATAKADSLRRNPDFGPDHTMVAAYLEIAAAAAAETSVMADVDRAVTLHIDNGELDLDGMRSKH